MNDLVSQPRQPAFDLSPQTFEQALTFSNYLADSDLVPKDFKGKPGNCLVAIQWGFELNLKPLQAIQNIAIINGRPSLWGDAVIALVRGSAVCESVIETDDGHTATCRVKRRGEPEQVRTFSMDDAKTAGLAGKQGPWTQYPKRMRQMRARAFALRDVFPDVLRGMPIAEEVMDTPAERFMGPAEVVNDLKPVGWPVDTWEARLAEWRKAIAAGRATADAVIAKAQTKHTLTDAQKEAIRAPIENAVPVISAGDVSRRLADAQNVNALNEAAALIEAIADADIRKALGDEYDARLADLSA